MKLKTINIKGKEYVEVNERLIFFRKNYKNHALLTEVIDKTDDTILIKASVKNEQGITVATGHAEEVKGSTFINKTSYVENCETSAIGRCLGSLGIGIDNSVASFEEVANAVKQQQKVDTITKYTLDIGDANWEKVLKYVAANKNLGLEKVLIQLKKKYDIKTPIKKELSKLMK
jgi:hypothetical protein